MALHRETKRCKRGRQRILLVRTCLDKFLCCFLAIKRKNLNDDQNAHENRQFSCKQGKPLAKPVLPHTESRAENTRAQCKSVKSKVRMEGLREACFAHLVRELPMFQAASGLLFLTKQVAIDDGLAHELRNSMVSSKSGLNGKYEL